MRPRQVEVIRTALLTLLVIAAISAPALAQDLPKAARPEDVGLSSDRLKRLTAAFQADVENGKIPGAVILIAREGKVAYFEAIGFQDREKQLAMRRDSIFRIASMTKPIVSVAVMMLVEEGKIQLQDPVSVYLPELKDLKVGVERKAEGSDKLELALETPKREMTIHDLLRHTSGLTYGIFGDSLVKRAYREANVTDPTKPLAEMVTKLSKLPLAFHPGKRSVQRNRRTSWAVSSRLCRAWNLIASSRSALRNRCGWSTPASSSPIRKGPGSPSHRSIPRAASARRCGMPPSVRRSCRAAAGWSRQRPTTPASACCF